MNALLRPLLSLATQIIAESSALASVILKCRTHSQCQIQEVPGKREFPRTMKMSGWQIHSYGDLDEVQFSDNIRIPQVKLGTEVMVRVKAASINPIDVAMIGGYGATLLNMMRKMDLEFPLVVGRDFVGEVVYRGIGAPKFPRIGDTIMPKPKALGDLEASGILYSGLTAWSGLFLSGNLRNLCGLLRGASANRKRVLILGASGGVGTMAVQIAKNEDAQVFVTAAGDASDMLSKLGADCVIDYRDENFLQGIHSNGPYDIILDCAGYGPKFASTIECNFDNYVTFSSPLLRNMDSYGLISGTVRNAISLIEDNSRIVSQKSRGIVKWGYFVPLRQGMEYLKKLAEREKLKCIVDTVYGFNDAIEAYQRKWGDAFGHQYQ
uniref:Uncharacterized protein n=1 Tax=Phlebotomus papatasi TaxID=29031 RepID=A0A1B0D271_PHLPP